MKTRPGSLAREFLNFSTSEAGVAVGVGAGGSVAGSGGTSVAASIGADVEDREGAVVEGGGDALEQATDKSRIRTDMSITGKRFIGEPTRK